MLWDTLYMNIFLKTEVQIVILGTERVYILIGSKVMTQMQKNAER